MQHWQIIKSVFWIYSKQLFDRTLHELYGTFTPQITTYSLCR